MQINPVTAYGFLEVIQVPEGEYLLQQAANSVLGKELISMAQKRGTRTINLVRRHEVVDELKQLGCTSPTLMANSDVVDMHAVHPQHLPKASERCFIQPFVI